MAARPLRVAVVGATGAVGRALVQALEEAELPVASVRLLASERSAGTELEFRGEPRRVEVLREGALIGQDLAFLCAGAAVARTWAEPGKAGGCALVDLSPAFRADPAVPLVLPEVNPEALGGFDRRRLVAVPGAPAALLALALAPLHRAAGVERVEVVTLEAASGGGQRGVDELEGELKAMLAFQEPPPPTALPHRIAFNLVPAAGPLGEGGLGDDERGTVAEVRRLLGSSVQVAATSVRVPIFYGHTQLVSLRTRRPLAAAEARELLRAAPGVKVIDAPAEAVYPMPMLAVNDDAALVGRLRDDPTQERGLSLVIAGDNLRRGAATSAVGLARLLAERGAFGAAQPS